MKLSSTLVLLIAMIALPSATAGARDDIHAFGRGSWQQIREAHAGKPFIVHFWGVTCGPCRTEMPQWGQLLNERADLNLVTIDADLVPNAPTAVQAMLSESGLSTGAENWMFSDAFVERLRYEVDPSWQGEIPRTLLIAADGATTALEGTADFAQLAVWLDAQPHVRER
jgi:thiol-disulfide isomerase/thioredoxin